MTAQDWIARLGLLPHPEGGFFRETYRSAFPVTPPGGSPTGSCTSIHYLLRDEDFSAFHRLAYPEIWYFHEGVTLHVHTLDSRGNYFRHALGFGEGETLSLAVEPGTWFAADVPSRKGYALVSCAVAPAFDFSVFEMAKRKDLEALYPQHAEVLRRLCRE